MKYLLFLVSSCVLFPQAQTPLKVFQSSGSIGGQVWLQEPKASGSNWFKFKAPALVADVEIGTPNALPATDGECWTATTAGVSSWLPCSANAFIQSGNTFGATATLGTNDNFGLRFETNGTTRATLDTAGLLGLGTTSPGYRIHVVGGSGSQNIIGIASPAASNLMLLVANDAGASIGTYANLDFGVVTDSNTRWIFSNTGMLYPALNDTYDIGLTGTRVRGVYAKFGEFFKSGSTASSDYLDTRKYNIRDSTGGAGVWDLQADVTSAVSRVFLRDNVGDPYSTSYRVFSSAPANFTQIYSDWIPAKRSTGSGHSVTDTNYPSLGRSGDPWEKVWANDAAFADDVSIGDTLLVTGNAVLSGSSNTMSGTLAPGFDGLGSIGTASLRYGDVYGYDANFAGMVGIGGNPGYPLHIQGGSGGQNIIGIASPAATNLLLLISNDAESQIGNFANLGVAFMTDSVPRWRISATGMFHPNLDDTYDIALTGTRVRGVYAKFGEFFKSGSTSSSDYLDTRKYNIRDSAGGAGLWDVQATVTSAASNIYWRDNVGDPWLRPWRVFSSAPANFTDVFSDWIPAKRSTGSGHSVSDTDFPSLGRTGARWLALWADDATLTDDLTVGDALLVTGNAVFSGASNTMSGTMAPGFDGLGKIGTAALKYGEGHFVDLTITGTCTGCSGLPVADTASVVEGSADATKELRFEVDGFTTATVRTLTPQNASYTIAGTNIAQTFSSVLTMGANLLFSADNTHDIGSSGATRPRDIWVARDVAVAGTVAAGALNGTGSFPIAIGGTSIFTSGRVMQNVASYLGDWLPFASTTYNLGSASLKWLDLHTSFIDLYTDLTFNSGATFTGSMIPSANNSYSLGNTSFRMSTVATTNFNVSGTITAPSGSSALSTTKTVRDAAGTGTCTLIYSGGLLTGGTC